MVSIDGINLGFKIGWFNYYFNCPFKFKRFTIMGLVWGNLVMAEKTGVIRYRPNVGTDDEKQFLIIY